MCVWHTLCAYTYICAITSQFSYRYRDLYISLYIGIGIHYVSRILGALIH